MRTKTLKEYGLEYIEEMSKDRNLAQQEAQVVIAGAKQTILGPASSYTLKQVDKFKDYVQEQVSHILDAELNRITIKSLGRLRRIITEGEKFSQPESESTVSSDVLKRMNEDRTKIVKEKNDEIRKLQSELNTIKSSKKETENLITSKEEEIKRLESDKLTLKEENDLYKRLYDKASSQITNYEEIIEKIKKETQLKDEDYIVALEEMYESSENTKHQLVDEGIKQATEALKREQQLQIDSLNNKLKQEQEKSILNEQKYKDELKMLNEELDMAKIEIKDVKESRQVYGVDAPNTTTMILNYTQRLLSTHPLYAAMLILINLGGSMPMPSLAKSVGANPLRLREFLKDLELKGLVTISEDKPPVVEIVNL